MKGVCERGRGVEVGDSDMLKTNIDSEDVHRDRYPSEVLSSPPNAKPSHCSWKRICKFSKYTEVRTVRRGHEGTLSRRRFLLECCTPYFLKRFYSLTVRKIFTARESKQIYVMCLSKRALAWLVKASKTLLVSTMALPLHRNLDGVW